MMSLNEGEKKQSPRDEKVKKQREWIVSELKKKIPDAHGVGCFLCKWIVEDLARGGPLTGYPFDANGAPIFPRGGKIEHIKHEGFLLPT
jgi:hypothetical protein